jgi:hypothetical protein
MSNNDDNPILSSFIVGFVVGMIACIVMTLFTLSGETTIQSNKPIIPEKKLTTDGKTIDTLYIYKQ